MTSRRTRRWLLGEPFWIRDEERIEEDEVEGKGGVMDGIEKGVERSSRFAALYHRT